MCLRNRDGVVEEPEAFDASARGVLSGEKDNQGRGGGKRDRRQIRLGLSVLYEVYIQILLVWMAIEQWGLEFPVF
jgi:hypothetical protein